MNIQDSITENQQTLNRLSRQSPAKNKEPFFVSSAGGKVAGWVIKVISKYNYNFYNVRVVEISDPGAILRGNIQNNGRNNGLFQSRRPVYRFNRP